MAGERNREKFPAGKNGLRSVSANRPVAIASVSLSILLHLSLVFLRIPASYPARAVERDQEIKIVSAVVLKSVRAPSGNPVKIPTVVKPAPEKPIPPAPPEPEKRIETNDAARIAEDETPAEPPPEPQPPVSTPVGAETTENPDEVRPGSLGGNSDEGILMDAPASAVGDDLPGEPVPPAHAPGPASAPEKKTFIPFYRVDRKPERLTVAKPEYPSQARRMNVEGTVILEADIDENGNVVDVRVIKKAGFGFDEAAIAYIRGSKYTPARVGEKAVAVRIRQNVTFRLKD